MRHSDLHCPMKRSQGGRAADEGRILSQAGGVVDGTAGGPDGGKCVPAGWRDGYTAGSRLSHLRTLF
jgi:hypothetical protein